MAIIHDDAFLAWEDRAPAYQRGDPAWGFHAYRVSLFLLDCVRRDVRELRRRRAPATEIDQLHRSITSICANISEGLGRSSAAERSRFFGIALGSLRESQIWYESVSDQLPPRTAETRCDHLTELRKLLIGAQKWLSSKPKKARLV
jgi:four helix bundle protein